MHELKQLIFYLNKNSERCNQSASASFALFDEISQKTCAIQRFLNDIMKVLPVLHYLMKFYKRQVLFKE